MTVTWKATDADCAFSCPLESVAYTVQEVVPTPVALMVMVLSSMED